MIRTLALLCLIAAPAIGVTSEPFISVDWPWSAENIDLPISSADARDNSEWDNLDSSKKPAGLERFDFWCNPEDPRICAFMDGSGSLAGCLIALEKELLADSPYSLTELGFISWSIEVNGKVKDVWAIHIHFDYLATYRSQTDSSLKTLTKEGPVRVPFNGGSYTISRNPGDIGTDRSDFKYVRDNNDGRFYFYKMSPDLKCGADTLLPWYLVESTSWSVGFYVFVNRKVSPPRLSDIKTFIPKGPQCLYDLADSYSIFSVQIILETLEQ